MNIKATKLADACKAGDTVRCLGREMTGIVLRVLPLTSNPSARVQWSSGSIGRHTVTTLEVVARANNQAGAAA